MMKRQKMFTRYYIMSFCQFFSFQKNKNSLSFCLKSGVSVAGGRGEERKEGKGAFVHASMGLKVKCSFTCYYYSFIFLSPAELIFLSVLLFSPFSGSLSSSNNPLYHPLLEPKLTEYYVDPIYRIPLMFNLASSPLLPLFCRPPLDSSSFPPCVSLSHLSHLFLNPLLYIVPVILFTGLHHMCVSDSL